MEKFAIHGFWKHPVAAVMAFAMVSYFGLISTALAGKPSPRGPSDDLLSSLLCELVGFVTTHAPNVPWFGRC